MSEIELVVPTEDALPPLLPGFVRDEWVSVWCRFCVQWHHHGGVAGATGHRVAHCEKSWSPFKKTGYTIVPGTFPRNVSFGDAPKYYSTATPERLSFSDLLTVTKVARAAYAFDDALRHASGLESMAVVPVEMADDEDDRWAIASKVYNEYMVAKGRLDPVPDTDEGLYT